MDDLNPSADAGNRHPSERAEIRMSGYEPETGICWQFNNPGDRERRCKCPACDNSYPNRRLAYFGRCRSGQRWFWVASLYFDEGDSKATGYANTEDEALDAAMAAMRGFRDGKPIVARASHGNASLELKAINKAKRAAKPPPKTSDAHNVEYIWSWSKRYRVIKRTKKRIYYWCTGEPLDENYEPRDYGFGSFTDGLYADQVGFLDRQRFESGTDKRYSRFYFPSREALLEDYYRYRGKPPDQADLAALKQAMADAHPDKGGSSAAFIAARAAYVAARRMQRGTAR